MAKRHKAKQHEVRVELHIDMNDGRTIEAVAQLLLDLTRHRHEVARPGAKPAGRQAAKQPRRQRPAR